MSIKKHHKVYYNLRAVGTDVISSRYVNADVITRLEQKCYHDPSPLSRVSRIKILLVNFYEVYISKGSLLIRTT